MAGHAAADARECLRERDETAVLHFVADLAPARVITILFAAARVATGRLQMTARIRADPHIGPRRRDHQRTNSFAFGRIRNRPAAWIHVPKSIVTTDAANPGRSRVVDVPEPRDPRRIVGREHYLLPAHERA